MSKNGRRLAPWLWAALAGAVAAGLFLAAAEVVALIVARDASPVVAVGSFVVFPPNPAGKDPGECYTKVSTPADCVVTPGSGYEEELTGYRRLASRLDATFVDPVPFFCVQGYCPEFVGHTPIRRDGTHITEAYSRLLAPYFLERLRELAVFD